MVNRPIITIVREQKSLKRDFDRKDKIKSSDPRLTKDVVVPDTIPRDCYPPYSEGFLFV